MGPFFDVVHMQPAWPRLTASLALEAIALTDRLYERLRLWRSAFKPVAKRTREPASSCRSERGWLDQLGTFTRPRIEKLKRLCCVGMKTWQAWKPFQRLSWEDQAKRLVVAALPNEQDVVADPHSQAHAAPNKADWAFASLNNEWGFHVA